MNASLAIIVLSSAAAIVPQDDLTLRSIAERCVSKGGRPDLVLPTRARFTARIRDGASRLLRVRRYGFTFPESIQVAQKGRDARDDGAAARSDALMGTPNKKTPVPQGNLFSTSPRLEQQPPAAEPPAPRGAAPAPSAPPR